MVLLPSARCLGLGFFDPDILPLDVAVRGNHESSCATKTRTHVLLGSVFAVHALCGRLLDDHATGTRVGCGRRPATMGGAVGVVASLLCVFGMASLLVGLILRVAGGTRIVAVRDPRLRESIAFENI